jgi:hypothetical protein
MQAALGIEAQFREREEMRAEEGKPRAADDAKEQERPDSGPAPKATLRQGDET